MAKAAGCAAKLNPATLDAVLRKLPLHAAIQVIEGRWKPMIFHRYASLF
ncbi:MAG TPA: hypothetical protein VF749_01310 [Candidatus Acidoferrum sp.]